MAKLVLFLADGTTLDIPLERERTRIGRRPGTDLCLPYAAVSGEHAVVVTHASGTTIEDLGSTNGTLVNGVPIARHLLADGDRIDIGRQQLVYLADTSAPPPPAARRHGPARPAAVVRELVRRPPTVPAPPPETIEPAPFVAVVSGPNAGRRLPLAKGESLIGRVGTQVAAIRRDENGYRLCLVEGVVPPRLNGVVVGSAGAALRVGDEFEVAGARIAFARSPERSGDM